MHSETTEAQSVKKIVFASLLKPIDDTRMYEKMAVPLANAHPKWQIYVIGRKPIKMPPHSQNIHLFPLENVGRGVIQRLKATFKYFKILLKVKPEVNISNSVEFQLVNCLNKILFGSKILYDVQENNWRNILYLRTYPILLKLPLGLFVRLLEYLISPFIDHFLLAEKCYEKELSFIGKRYTILENKFKPPSPTWQFPAKTNISISLEQPEIRLLYTGTISTDYGIFEAVAFAQALQKIIPQITLYIVGYAAKNSELQQLKAQIAASPFIHLIGGNELVPHSVILEHIAQAHIGLLPYRINKSNQNRIPTKLYEYLAHQLPMIISNNPVWEEICEPYQAAIFTNFSKINNTKFLANKISFSKFYTQPISFSNLVFNNDLLLKSLANFSNN